MVCVRHFCSDPASNVTPGTGPWPTEQRDGGPSDQATIDVVWDLDAWARAPLTSPFKSSFMSFQQFDRKWKLTPSRTAAPWNIQKPEPNFLISRWTWGFFLPTANVHFLLFCGVAVVWFQLWLHLSLTFIDLSFFLIPGRLRQDKLIYGKKKEWREVKERIFGVFCNFLFYTLMNKKPYKHSQRITLVLGKNSRLWTVNSFRKHLWLIFGSWFGGKIDMKSRKKKQCNVSAS